MKLIKMEINGGKIMRKLKKYLAIALTAVMAMTMTVPVMAADGDGDGGNDNAPVVTPVPTIDKTKNDCSITVTKYQYNNGDFEFGVATGTEADEREELATLEGVEFTLYQVLNADDTFAYYNGLDTTANPAVSYTVDDFITTVDNVKVIDPAYDKDEEAGTQGAKYIAKYTDKTDSDGKITFDNLPVGMYVLIETSTKDTKPNPDTVKTISEPALISLPMVNTYNESEDADGNPVVGTTNDVTKNSDWLYDVNVYPKNETYGAKIVIQKYGTSDDTDGDGLDDVSFKLTKFTDATYTAIDTNAATTYDLDGTTAKVTKDGSEIDNPDGVGVAVRTTADGGKLEAFENIPAGYYELVEIKAPAGYIVNKTPIRFTVNKDNSITCNTAFTGLTLTDGTKDEVTGEYKSLKDVAIPDDTNGATEKRTSDDEMRIKLVNEKPTMEKFVMVDPTEGSLVDKTFDDATETIVDKTIDPSAAEFEDKWGTSADYSIGDKVYYRIDVYVPHNISYLTDFTIVDTPTGLTDVKVEAIKYENGVDTEGKAVIASLDFSEATGTDAKPCTVTIDASKNLKVVFNTGKLPETVAGKKVSIYYSSVLNTDATIAGDGNSNKANLKYSEYVVTPEYPDLRTDGTNNTTDEKTIEWEIDDYAVVYTYQFDITKKKDNKDGEAISGVEFQLLYSKNSDPIQLIDEGKGVYRMPTAKELEENDAKLVTKLVTPAAVAAAEGVAAVEAGKIVVKGLESRDYYLKEIKTIDGYNLLSEPFKIDLNIEVEPTWITPDSNNSAVGQNGQKYITKMQNTQTYANDKSTDSEIIINKKGFTLPRTGTLGPVLFGLIGLILIIGGMFVLFGGKKREN